MKKHFLVLILTIAMASSSYCQKIGLNLNVGLRKTFELHKKLRLDVRQQFQIIPEIEDLEYSQGDFFNEEGFWPVSKAAESDLPYELSDAPKKISFEKRSSSSVQFIFQAHKWVRLTTGYGLVHNGFKPRHTCRFELDYRPLKHFKEKGKFDIAVRGQFQKVGAEHKKKKIMRWEALFTPRVDLIWTFKKRHALTWSSALNGAWDEDILTFDRLRNSLTVSYQYKKNHRFSLVGQSQVRLGKPKSSTGLSLSYEIKL